MTRTQAVRIPCCVDVPESYDRKARYALRMLLLPFRADPFWTDRDGVRQGGIYYGSNPESISGDAWRIGFLDSTAEFFLGRKSGPPTERTARMDGVDIPVCFESRGDAPFDVAAACFYLLSGWQEAHTKVRDEHGRYPFEESIQCRHRLVEVPMVERFRRLLEKEMATRNVRLERKTWGPAGWAFCPTHDVDYLRKWRPGIVYREIVERGVLNRSGERVGRRIRRAASAVTGLVSAVDPYRRALGRMRDEVVARGGKSTFFFKTAAHGPRDVRYAPTGSFVQDQYLHLRNAGFEIGLHPSYHAYDHGLYLREEFSALSHATGLKPVSVRTHYLRFDPVSTPALLAETGFTIDSTLGFSERAGFRRGTCLPFPLYDMTADRELEIWEMPLAVMESTLFNREGLDLQAALDTSGRILDACRSNKGVFVGLWHNILWDEMDAPGWGSHFSGCLDRAVTGEARIDTLRDALAYWK